mmetsp:Transcript_134796/g.430771  ORF Transcript_134796/g.430771 Transcript_134796/m.430771 type:complete len:240 (+) Transcript_134796:505-1224(+)
MAVVPAPTALLDGSGATPSTMSTASPPSANRSGSSGLGAPAAAPPPPPASRQAARPASAPGRCAAARRPRGHAAGSGRCLPRWRHARTTRSAHLTPSARSAARVRWIARGRHWACWPWRWWSWRPWAPLAGSAAWSGLLAIRSACPRGWCDPPRQSPRPPIRRSSRRLRIRRKLARLLRSQTTSLAPAAGPLRRPWRRRARTSNGWRARQAHLASTPGLRPTIIPGHPTTAGSASRPTS